MSIIKHNVQTAQLWRGGERKLQSEVSMEIDWRRDELDRWVAGQLGQEGLRGEPASSDASFRRYFRYRHGGRSVIAMDAPPEREDCRPFVRVAELMRQAGVHVPAVLAQDLTRGFLLLQDLGRDTYLDVLDEHSADALFGDALGALLALQQAEPGPLPRYDEALLRRELELFPQWYLERHLGLTLDARWRDVLERVFRLLIDSALAQSCVLVHRDFMPRNLMCSDPNPGVLDFQDAVIGPISYDPVCLFRDAFISWPEVRVESWLRTYWQGARDAGLPVPADFAAFQRDCDWMGAQRHLKVIGIFARIRYRDGKPAYFEDVPRFFRYLEAVAERYAELAPLRELLALVAEARSEPA